MIWSVLACIGLSLHSLVYSSNILNLTFDSNILLYDVFGKGVTVVKKSQFLTSDSVIISGFIRNNEYEEREVCVTVEMLSRNRKVNVF